MNKTLKSPLMVGTVPLTPESLGNWRKIEETKEKYFVWDGNGGD